MFKKLWAVLTVLVTLAAAPGFTGYADNSLPISIYVNEKEIISDQSTYIEDGTTYIPLRAISNAMGITDISWDNSQKKATIKGYSKIEVYIGRTYAYVNGEKKKLTKSAQIRNGRTMVPLRFFAENSEANVEWDSLLHCVKITKDGVSVPSQYVANNYSPRDVKWLSQIVEAESAGEPLEGQIAVANVVLNRVKDKNYPNTIQGVIFDRNYGVQFQPVINGTIYNTPSKKCITAAKRAIAGENNVGNCLYFLNESIATSMWIVNNRDHYVTIHNHSFYL